jgi:hypothetical protein
MMTKVLRQEAGGHARSVRITAMNQLANLKSPLRGLYVKARRAVSERDNVPLWHAIAVIAIMAAAFVLFYKSFTNSGMIIHQDMTFPTSLARNMSQYVSMWWQYGSAQNIFSVQRLFWGYPLLLIARALHIPNNTYLFLMFWSTFSLAGISMYSLTYHFIRRTSTGSRVKYAIFGGSVLAAIIYMYNPWSLNHFWGYFAYPPYALAPLIFLAALRAFDSPTFARIFLLALLLTLGSTGPICVVWIWLLVVSYAVYRLVVNRFRRPELKSVLKVIVPSAAIYVLINATWLLPYLNARIAGATFVPNYNNLMSQSMLDGLSSNNTIINNIRLISGWGAPVNPPVNNTMWVILSFGLPLLALAGLLIYRKNLSRNQVFNFWSVMFVASILLATGSSFVLRHVYSTLALNATLGWVIRAPDRWLFYVPVFYSLMIGMLFTGLLENQRVPQPLSKRFTEEVPQQVE